MNAAEHEAQSRMYAAQAAEMASRGPVGIAWSVALSQLSRMHAREAARLTDPSRASQRGTGEVKDGDPGRV